MTRTLLSRLLPLGLLVGAALSGCMSASPPPPPVHPGWDQRLSQRDATSDHATLVLDVTGPSKLLVGSLSEGDLDETSAPEDETVVAVDEDAFGDSARALRFVPETRGGETLGVRVLFNERAAGGEDATYLGLRHADRIEEIDGLPVASLRALSEAWQGVGRKPEVRLLISRGGRAHALVYRSRTPAIR